MHKQFSHNPLLWWMHTDERSLNARPTAQSVFTRCPVPRGLPSLQRRCARGARGCAPVALGSYSVRSNVQLSVLASGFWGKSKLGEMKRGQGPLKAPLSRAPCRQQSDTVGKVEDLEWHIGRAHGYLQYI